MHWIIKQILLSGLTILSLFMMASCSPPPPAADTKPVPTNVILLIGDGMGFNQMKAASCYNTGQEKSQIYHSFPIQYAMSTYMANGSYDPDTASFDMENLKQGATDSAAAATALACGIKTYRYSVGVDCNRNPVKNIIDLAEEMGKSTGIVTSVQMSHATPAAFAAHNVTRRNYEEIAREMLLTTPVDVIMGCGHPWYDNDGQRLDQPQTFQYVGGKKLWQELGQGIAGNDADHDGIADPWLLIETKQAFQHLAKESAPKRLLGIPQVGQTLQQKRSSQSDASAPAPYATPSIQTVPALHEMAAAALNVLKENPKGFFLMIEGGAIDWACHANQSDRLIEEQLAFDKTADLVVQWVETHSNWEDTLVIVTADHETGCLSGSKSTSEIQPLEPIGKKVMPDMVWHSQSHTNSLVPLFARGRHDLLFKKHVSGNDPKMGPYVDNTSIFEVMAEAINP